MSLPCRSLPAASLGLFGLLQRMGSGTLPGQPCLADFASWGKSGTGARDTASDCKAAVGRLLRLVWTFSCGFACACGWAGDAWRQGPRGRHRHHLRRRCRPRRCIPFVVIVVAIASASLSTSSTSSSAFFAGARLLTSIGEEAAVVFKFFCWPAVWPLAPWCRACCDECVLLSSSAAEPSRHC